MLVAETDGYLTANAPWKKPAERSEADHAALAGAGAGDGGGGDPRDYGAGLSDPAGFGMPRFGMQLGQGEIADAAKNGFLTNLAWGGLKAGTKFGEPAPLFPRAEKDAVERMQNLEDENNKSVVEAASKAENAATSAPEAPPSSLPIAPAPPPASPSVNPVHDPSREVGAGAPHQSENSSESKATAPTHAPVDPEKPTATTTVHHGPGGVGEQPAECCSCKRSCERAA